MGSNRINLLTQVQGILPEQFGGMGTNYGLRFADAETPSGAINGVNGTFTLAFSPFPAAGLLLFYSKNLQVQGTDYTLSANTINMTVVPTGGSLLAWYRYASGPLSRAVLTESLSMSDLLVLNASSPQITLQFIEQLSLVDTVFFVGPVTYLTLADSESGNWGDVLQDMVIVLLNISDQLVMNDWFWTSQALGDALQQRDDFHFVLSPSAAYFTDVVALTDGFQKTLV
jgi:hypothetical protein